MPGSKKKRITAENVVSTSASSSPSLPDQQEFHQHLRTLAQSAVRTVLETVMCEELDAFIGVAWGECRTPKRKVFNSMKREGVKARPDLGSDIFCYAPFTQLSLWRLLLKCPSC